MGASARAATPPGGRDDRGATPAGPAAAPDGAPGGDDLRRAEQVERALRATGYPTLRHIQATVGGPLVLLRGRVPSYYLKQLAQEAARGVAEGREVRNEIQVIR
jgi:hypothetical protein